MQRSKSFLVSHNIIQRIFVPFFQSIFSEFLRSYFQFVKDKSNPYFPFRYVRLIRLYIYQMRDIKNYKASMTMVFGKLETKGTNKRCTTIIVS